MVFNSLQSLPESMGSLTALQHSELQRCSSLQSLPESNGSVLTALHRLKLDGCSFWQSLLESIVSLSALQVLGLNGFQLVAEPARVHGLTTNSPTSSKT